MEIQRKSFMPRPGGYPGASRDFWGASIIKCDRKVCVANYGGKCISPALLEIGEDGKCKNCKPRKDGEVKS